MARVKRNDNDICSLYILIHYYGMCWTQSSCGCSKPLIGLLFVVAPINMTLCSQVLLVTSSSRPDHWIVPGGGVEPEEEPAMTAIREVIEEAGVLGKLGRRLGVFEV